MHARFIWHLTIGALAPLHLHAPIAGARATGARVNHSWDALVGSARVGTRLAVRRGELATMDAPTHRDRSIVLTRKEFVLERKKSAIEIDAEGVIRVERAGERGGRTLRRGRPSGPALFERETVVATNGR